MALRMLYEQDSQSVWLHDFGLHFIECMILGNEWRYIVFEAALLGALDLGLSNVAQAAIITYGVHVALHEMLSHFASRNLSRKALIPDTFLL